MGLNVDRILFFHGIQNEAGKTQKWPQDQNHREESSKDGHPESVLFHVAQTHPDGDNRGKKDIGGKQGTKED